MHAGEILDGAVLLYRHRAAAGTLPFAGARVRAEAPDVRGVVQRPAVA